MGNIDYICKKIGTSIVRGSKSKRGYLTISQGDYVCLLPVGMYDFSQNGKEQTDMINEFGPGPFKVVEIMVVGKINKNKVVNEKRLIFVTNEEGIMLGLEWWRCYFHFRFINI